MFPKTPAPSSVKEPQKPLPHRWSEHSGKCTCSTWDRPKLLLEGHQTRDKKTVNGTDRGYVNLNICVTYICIYLKYLYIYIYMYTCVRVSINSNLIFGAPTRGEKTGPSWIPVGGKKSPGRSMFFFTKLLCHTIASVRPWASRWWGAPIVV